MTTCEPCGSGFVSGPVSKDCEACPAGTEQPNANGAATCTACGVGRYNGDSGVATCTECDPGYYAQIVGLVACNACPRGTHSPAGAEVCEPCPENTFNDQVGQETCQDCPLGKSSLETGAFVCEDCERGDYFNTTTATCTACPAGSFNNNDTSVFSCEVCPQGQYQDAQGQTKCLNCPKGSFAPAAGGATDCTPCPAGTYSDELGLTECLDCPQGTDSTEGAQVCSGCVRGEYFNTTLDVCLACPAGRVSDGSSIIFECDACPSGRFADVPGQSLCTECPPGQFSEKEGSVGCDLCPKGEATDQAGSSSCTACAIGRFAQERGSSICFVCQEGSFQNSTGAEACELCDSGSFQTGTSPTECSPCAAGTFSTAGASGCSPCDPASVSAEGAGSCSACPAFSSASADRTECSCRPGFAATKDAASDDLECTACPVGLQCNQPAQDGSEVSAAIMVEPGYWARPTENAFELPRLYRCLALNHCAGGELSSSEDQLCSEFRTGVLCSACAPGYSAGSTGSACKLCPEEGQATGLTVLFLLLFVAAICMLYYAVLRFQPVNMKALARDLGIEGRRRTSTATSRARGSVESGGRNLSRTSLGSEVSLAVSNGSAKQSLFSPEALKDQEGKFNAQNPSDVRKHIDRDQPAGMTYNFKALVSFLQLATAVTGVVDIEWPSGFKSVTDALTFINFDFVPWNTLSCVVQIDFYTKFWVMCVTPVLAMGMLAAGFFSLMWLLDRRDNNDDTLLVRVKRKAQFTRLMLFTLFLLYPGVSARVLGFFACREVEGKWYLLADMSLGCGLSDRKWSQYLPMAVVFVMVYALGIPAVFFYSVWRNRANLKSVRTSLAVGWLYEGYNARDWWFEVADMANKLMITAVLVLFRPTTQLAVGAITSALYILLIQYRQPFVRRTDDRMYLVVNMEIGLLFLAGLAMEEEVVLKKGSDLDVALSMVLLLLIAFVLLTFVYHAVIIGRKALQQHKRKRLKVLVEKAETLMQEETEANDNESELVAQRAYEEDDELEMASQSASEDEGMGAFAEGSEAQPAIMDYAEYAEADNRGAYGQFSEPADGDDGDYADDLEELEMMEE